MFFKNKFIFIFILVILLLLSCYVWYFIFFAGGFFIWIFCRFLWYEMIVISLLAISLFLFLFFLPQLYFLIFHHFIWEHGYFHGRVIAVHKKFYVVRLWFDYNVIVYKSYYFSLQLNDTFFAKGSFIAVSNTNKYFFSINVNATVTHFYLNYGSLHHHFHLRNAVSSYLNDTTIHNRLFDFGKLIIFNLPSTFGNSIYNWGLKYNVVQYFVISGLHVLCILNIFEIFIKKWRYLQFFFVILLFFYAYALNFAVPITRFCCVFAISSCLNFKRVVANKFDIFAWVGFLYLLYNPHIIFNISFQFSFFVTFALLWLRNEKFLKQHYLLQIFYINLVGFSASLLLMLVLKLPINFLGLFLSFFLFFLVEIAYVFFFFLIYCKFLFAWTLTYIATNKIFL